MTASTSFFDTANSAHLVLFQVFRAVFAVVLDHNVVSSLLQIEVGAYSAVLAKTTLEFRVNHLHPDLAF